MKQQSFFLRRILLSVDSQKVSCTVTHCNTLQHTATHCNALQHTATHCNALWILRKLMNHLLSFPVVVRSSLCLRSRHASRADINSHNVIHLTEFALYSSINIELYKYDISLSFH